jgi:hypothetical protein
MVTAILARDGGNRWCEFVIAPPPAAEAFALLYPQTRFLIVHRRADAVMRAIIDASPWGLAGAEFAPFVSVSPSSTAAALASFWVSHTAQLLEFEQGHRGSCLRIRIEDLRVNPAQSLRDINNFLSLDGEHILRGLFQDIARDELTDAHLSATPTGIPLSQIPAPLLAQINELHSSLGYAPVTAVER